MAFVASCCSVAQSCPTLCDPMDCSTPGFPVFHHLPEFAQTQSIESMMPSHSNHLTSPSVVPFCSQSFPASGSFPMSWLFVSGGQSYVISWIYNLLTNIEQLSCLQMLKTLFVENYVIFPMVCFATFVLFENIAYTSICFRILWLICLFLCQLFNC